MPILGNRLWRRTVAQQTLSDLLASTKTVFVIHYSCESFAGGANGSSPRITSIAVRRYISGQTKSFAIHQEAECETQNGQIDEQNYDRLEKKMLRKFYKFVAGHQEHTWLHWNMRDTKYGFPAIAHRYDTLGGSPADIHESNRVDLARLLVSLYGRRYAPHPRLQSIFELNQMCMTDFMTGQQEADAFDNGDYLSIHQSTLRKVDNLCGLLERVADGKLKTNARAKDIYGSRLESVKEFLRKHWFVPAVGLVAGAYYLLTSILWPLISSSPTP